MRKLWRHCAVLCGLTMFGAGLLSGDNQAQARPQYLKAFTEKYPQVDAAKTIKCGVCHPETAKKIRNDYGQAIAKSLQAKNVKDTEKIASAFSAAEKAQSKVEGKTFGDLLKEGQLPDPKE